MGTLRQQHQLSAFLAFGLGVFGLCGAGPADEAGAVPAWTTQLQAAGEALAAANAEVGELRAERERLRLQMESLGVAALKPEVRAVQERLVKALGELSAAKRGLTAITESHNRVVEAGAAVLSNPRSEVARAALEAAVASAGKVSLGVNRPQPATVPLDAARVVSYKPELSLAVINGGRQSGLRPGTPLEIVRGDQFVASGSVVDLRERIAGILVTGSPATVIKVGDAIRPHTESPISEQ
jgi:hypothetical protein